MNKNILAASAIGMGLALAGCSGTTEAEQSKIVTATPTPTPTVTVTKKAKPKKAPEPDVIIVQPAPTKTVTQAPPSNSGEGEYLPSNEEQYLWEIYNNPNMNAQAGYPSDRGWVKIAGDICNENDKKGTLTAISDWSRNSSLSQDNVLYMWSAASGWYCPEYLYDIPQD